MTRSPALTSSARAGPASKLPSIAPNSNRAIHVNIDSCRCMSSIPFCRLLCKMNGGVLEAKRTHDCEDHKAERKLDDGIARQPPNRGRPGLALRGRSKPGRPPQPIHGGEGEHHGKQDKLDR